jgi:hypothetical protein
LIGLEESLDEMSEWARCQRCVIRRSRILAKKWLFSPVRGHGRA